MQGEKHCGWGRERHVSTHLVQQDFVFLKKKAHCPQTAEHQLMFSACSEHSETGADLDYAPSTSIRLLVLDKKCHYRRNVERTTLSHHFFLVLSLVSFFSSILIWLKVFEWDQCLKSYCEPVWCSRCISIIVWNQPQELSEENNLHFFILFMFV